MVDIKQVKLHLANAKACDDKQLIASYRRCIRDAANLLNREVKTFKQWTTKKK